MYFTKVLVHYGLWIWFLETGSSVQVVWEAPLWGCFAIPHSQEISLPTEGRAWMLTSKIQEEILKYCVSNKNSVEGTYREKDHLSLGGNKEGFSEVRGHLKGAGYWQLWLVGSDGVERMFQILFIPEVWVQRRRAQDTFSMKRTPVWLCRWSGWGPRERGPRDGIRPGCRVFMVHWSGFHSFYDKQQHRLARLPSLWFCPRSRVTPPFSGVSSLCLFFFLPFFLSLGIGSFCLLFCFCFLVFLSFLFFFFLE